MMRNKIDTKQKIKIAPRERVSIKALNVNTEIKPSIFFLNLSFVDIKYENNKHKGNNKNPA